MEAIDRFIARTKADIRFGGTKAFYNDALDFVQMPPRSAFASELQFYGVAFHELVHWTGHPRRLDRLFVRRITGNAVVSAFYAAYEEAIAYIGEGLLFIHFGLNPEADPVRAAQLAASFKATHESADAIAAALKRARRAVRYLSNRYIAK